VPRSCQCQWSVSVGFLVTVSAVTFGSRRRLGSSHEERGSSESAEALPESQLTLTTDTDNCLTTDLACAHWLDTMGFMRAIMAAWFLAFLLTIQCVPLSELHAQPPSSSDPLTQAQIENQRAQATYYQRQADKRGFWRSLREYGGPIGAAVAAIVAIVSFGLYYRATLRSRADTKFYEALNLLADRKNSNVRASAAGLLEQMASTRKRYYDTAFDQLSVGLLAEREDDARHAIRTALSRLTELDPVGALAKLEAVNRTLRDALAELFCRFCVAREVLTIEQLPPSIWREAEEVTSYDRQALSGLLGILPKDNLDAAVTSASRLFQAQAKSEVDDFRARTRAELGEGADRLRSNIRSISELLFFLEGKGGKFGSSARNVAPRSFSFAFLVGGKFGDLQEAKISRSILREADFAAGDLTRAVILESDFSKANLSGAKLCQVKCSGTNFVGAILTQADLTGARFQGSDFTGADLTGARFRKTEIALSALEHTEWWKADFRSQRDLLKAVHAKYKKDLPDLESLYVRGDIHRSVLDFIGKITEERL
jgi:pentapeptide repeat protein